MGRRGSKGGVRERARLVKYLPCQHEFNLQDLRKELGSVALASPGRVETEGL